jgi:hypothetical protein
MEEVFLRFINEKDTKENSHEDNTNVGPSEADMFVNEFEPVKRKVFHNFKSRPTNIVEYEKFNSVEYKEYKLKQRVIQLLQGLKIPDLCVNEIYEMCLLHKKSSGLEIKEIIAIITYKMVKKNGFNIPYQEIFQRLKYRKSKYLKNAGLIQIDENKPIADENNIEKFKNKIDEFLNFIIPKLIALYEIKPKLFKINVEQIDLIIRSLGAKLTNENKLEKNKNNYFDITKVIYQIKDLINKAITNDFYYRFEQTHIEPLVGALIKLYLKKLGLTVTLKVLSELVQVSEGSISKLCKKLEDYII